MSAFERALSAGLNASRRVAGTEVLVTRGASTITVSFAIQGQTSKVPIGADTESTVDAADWFISAAAYTFGVPAVGDIITRVIDGTTYTYTVETPDFGMQCWDWSDTAKTQYRIHSRKDGASAFDISKPNGFDLSGTEWRYV